MPFHFCHDELMAITMVLQSIPLVGIWWRMRKARVTVCDHEHSSECEGSQDR